MKIQPGRRLTLSWLPCLPVCSEHGISRSVTVVLAYLMWSEGLPLRILFQNLKTQKPEIR